MHALDGHLGGTPLQMWGANFWSIWEGWGYAMMLLLWCHATVVRVLRLPIPTIYFIPHLLEENKVCLFNCLSTSTFHMLWVGIYAPLHSKIYCYYAAGRVMAMVLVANSLLVAK